MFAGRAWRRATARWRNPAQRRTDDGRALLRHGWPFRYGWASSPRCPVGGPTQRRPAQPRRGGRDAPAVPRRGPRGRHRPVVHRHGWAGGPSVARLLVACRASRPMGPSRYFARQVGWATAWAITAEADRARGTVAWAGRPWVREPAGSPTTDSARTVALDFGPPGQRAIVADTALLSHGRGLVVRRRHRPNDRFRS
jgi:hypothetical protein